MKRLGQFLRSVTPADPWQVLYLAGAVFLFLSPRLSWRLGDGGSFSLLALALIPAIVAGVFAYYGCFHASAYPLRRVTLAVFLPTLLSFALIIGEFAVFNGRSQSVFVQRSVMAAFWDECVLAFKVHPSGFSLAVISLALLGTFVIRMHLGSSTIPLCLARAGHPDEEIPASWNDLQMLIFVLVCPLFLLGRISALLFSFPNWPWYRSSLFGFSVYIVTMEVVAALLLVLVAILILGKSGRKSARSSLELPEPRFALLGLVLPVVISLTIASFQYGYDRAYWNANDFGRLSPPEFTSYFSMGESWHWALALFVFAAFAEEIVFRGMLLSRLVRRYGSHRGIFFTGLIWAAYHFHGDMHQRYSILQALLEIASRVGICMAMNYVLSWMTLRWRSVIPAAIAHTVSNMLVVGGVNKGVPFAHEMRIVCWAVCAVVLFRIWPIKEDAGEESSEAANLETAGA